MSGKKLMKLSVLPIMVVFLSCSLLIGCAKTITRMPEIPETEARQVYVPNLKLEPRPKIDLTDEQIIKLHQTFPDVTGEILRNQADWDAFADVADAAVDGYKSWGIKILSGGQE